MEKPPEASTAMHEVHRVHQEARNRPAITTKLHTAYSTPWINQTLAVVQRSITTIWHNPTCVTAKLVYRLFMVPGMGYCFGGPGAWKIGQGAIVGRGTDGIN